MLYLNGLNVACVSCHEPVAHPDPLQLRPHLETCAAKLHQEHLASPEVRSVMEREIVLSKHGKPSAFYLDYAAQHVHSAVSQFGWDVPKMASWLKKKNFQVIIKGE